MKKIITISREYGSGGRIIGKKIAENLGEWAIFGGFEERTAAGIKHLRRLQARRVRGAQTRRLSSPAL